VKVDTSYLGEGGALKGRKQEDWSPEALSPELRGRKRQAGEGRENRRRTEGGSYVGAGKRRNSDSWGSRKGSPNLLFTNLLGIGVRVRFWRRQVYRTRLYEKK